MPAFGFGFFGSRPSDMNKGQGSGRPADEHAQTQRELDRLAQQHHEQERSRGNGDRSRPLDRTHPGLSGRQTGGGKGHGFTRGNGEHGPERGASGDGGGNRGTDSPYGR